MTRVGSEATEGGLFDDITRRGTSPGGFAFPEPNIAPLHPQLTSYDPQALQAQQQAQQASSRPNLSTSLSFMAK